MKVLLPLLLIVCQLAVADNKGDEMIVKQLAADNREDPRQEGLLFWSQAERRSAFKQMNKIFPARNIEAGDNPYPLTPEPVDLSSVTYSVDGASFTLQHFLDMPSNIGLIVIKDDIILFERYAQGNSKDTTWISFSVTKSVTSMLIGAALHEGYIKSVDEPVANYLPRLRGTGYEKATIRNVLNMASGIRWNEDYADPDSDVSIAGGANSLELVEYLGQLPRKAVPGEKFNYNTGETNLVGEILRAAIGNNAATYLTHRIWQPFGMGDDAFWLLGDTGGGELGGCCINATLRDYARLGIFAMKDGILPDGTRVLPEDWMLASTTPSKGYDRYGYLWWVLGKNYYAALGIFGQQIRIDPAHGIVIAMHSNAPAAVGSRYHTHQKAALEAIRQFVIARQVSGSD